VLTRHFCAKSHITLFFNALLKSIIVFLSLTGLCQILVQLALHALKVLQYKTFKYEFIVLCHLQCCTCNGQIERILLQIFYVLQ